MFSISKPFDPTGVFPALPFLCLINIPCILSHPYPDCVPLSPVSTPSPTTRSAHSLVHSPNSINRHPAIYNMPAVVSNATRIWELNIYWDLFSQCGVWDPKGRGVDIWECIRARTFHSVDCHPPLIRCHTDQSTPGTQVSRQDIYTRRTCFY